MVDIELIKLKKQFNSKLDKIIRKDIKLEKKCFKDKRIRKLSNRKQVKALTKSSPNFPQNAADFTKPI